MDGTGGCRAVGAEGVPVVDAAGRAVIPGFVDSHTHLVFAGDRAAEFAARMAGETYAAGGIRTTVAATRAASDHELRSRLRALVETSAARRARRTSRSRPATASTSSPRRGSRGSPTR